MDELIIKSENEAEDGYINYDMHAGAGQEIQGGQLTSIDGNGNEYGNRKIDEACNNRELESRNLHFDSIVRNLMESGNMLSDSTTTGSLLDDRNMQFNSSGQNVLDFGNMQFNSTTGNVRKRARNVVDGTNIRFEFTAGYRRNSLLIYLVEEKQLFTKKYSHKNMDRYTCYNKSCRASMLFDNASNRIVKLYNTYHLHPDQSEVYKKMKVLNEMKDYCLTNDGSNMTTKQIFDQKCNVMKEAAHLVEYNRIKRNLNRLKKCAMQKPNTDSYEETHGMFANDLWNLSNEFNSDTKPTTKPLPIRAPSPSSSDNDSLAAESHSNIIIQTSTPSVSLPSQPTPTVPASTFKKIKLTQTQEVPFTEGYLDNSRFELKTAAAVKKSPPRQTQNPRVHYEPEAHICSSCPCIAAQESEYDKIGKTWAMELKKMTPEQQIFAKRAIAEIIFEGQMGSLSRSSVRVHQVCRGNDDDPLIEETVYYEKNEIL